MPPTYPKASTTRTTANPETALRVGHVYLEIDSRKLHWLNEAARQLHQEGVPVGPTDLADHPMQTPEGKTVEAADLPLVRAWREGQPQEATFLLPRPGGRVDQVHWTATPLDSDGDVVAVFGTFSVVPPAPDWQMLAGLAHDLRSPLQALQLFLAVLEKDESLTGQAREVATLMQNSAERARAIARELLEWCRRPAEGSKRPERTLIALAPFLKAILDEHTPAARRKRLTLVNRCEAAAGWEIYADRVRLGRLLSNLLTNAIRYTALGRVEFTAQWRELAPSRGEQDPFGAAESARNRRPALVLSVVDTGAGIAEDEQESIFQPFERGRGGNKEQDSSGLGLAVAERLVEELGLALEVYSVFGQGSAFDLIIPSRMLHPVQEA
jgi:hypothetical protein